MQDITHKQLGTMTPEVIDALDCTIVVCMINAKEGQQLLTFSEMSGIGVHVIELCRKLLRHKRGGIILGGSADLWSFDPAWDVMVKKAILICRAHGILAIDGAHYFRRMQLQPGGGMWPRRPKTWTSC